MTGALLLMAGCAGAASVGTTARAAAPTHGAAPRPMIAASGGTQRRSKRKRASKGRRGRVDGGKQRRRALIRQLKHFQDHSPVLLNDRARRAMPAPRLDLWDRLLTACGRWASEATSERDRSLAQRVSYWLEDQLALERRRYQMPPVLRLRIDEQIRFALGRARRAPVILRAHGLAPSWPVDDVVVSSFFGPRTDPMGGGKGQHEGIDFAVPVGTAVFAAVAGRVSKSGPAGGYGKLVVIDHAGGWQSRYAHLDAIDVGVGDEVGAGRPIAKSGNSGRSTGPHLHFELRRDGAAVDPLSLAGWRARADGSANTSRESGGR